MTSYVKRFSKGANCPAALGAVSSRGTIMTVRLSKSRRALHKDVAEVISEEFVNAE
jgi:hypothetical protein